MFSFEFDSVVGETNVLVEVEIRDREISKIDVFLVSEDNKLVAFNTNDLFEARRSMRDGKVHIEYVEVDERLEEEAWEQYREQGVELFGA